MKLLLCYICEIKQTVSEFWPSQLKSYSYRCKACCNKEAVISYHKHKAKRLIAAKNRRQLKREWFESLKDKPCMDCRESYPYYVMDFDHRDKLSKITDVSQMVYKLPKHKILAEIAKCDLICANCHRLRTWGNLCLTKKQ